MTADIKAWVEERRTMAGFDGWTSDQITKAGLPRALDALSKVLEVLDAGVRDGDSAELIRSVALNEIEGAINDD